MLFERRNFLKILTMMSTISIPRTTWAANWGKQMPSLFVLNGVNMTHYKGYTISIFDGAAKVPVPKWPVIHGGTLASPGGNSGIGPNDHVAWPSILELSGGYRIFANRRYNGAWQDIAVWESDNGIDFALTGTAVTLVPGETDLGPSTVFLDPGSARPFKVMFQSRKPGDMTGIEMASSITGAAGTWQREGSVIDATESWESHSRNPNFVTRHNGQWALHYSSGDKVSGGGALAFSNDPGGPYTNKKMLTEATGIRYSVIHGAAGFSFAEISGQVVLNQPYMIHSGGPVEGSGDDEIVFPIYQNGTTTHFDKPLRNTYGKDASLSHFGFFGYALKYATELPDGTWIGYATCQSMMPRLREYVAQLKAPAFDGPWTFDNRSVVFPPWDGWHLHSCENPAPLLDATAL